jgi:geranylgeranyl pyrophosphate synthase
MNKKICTFSQALFPSTSEEEKTKAGKVAATIEMLQTFFLIEDDLMDHGVRRRGKPCWHTLVNTVYLYLKIINFFPA